MMAISVQGVQRLFDLSRPVSFELVLILALIITALVLAGVFYLRKGKK